MADTLNEIIKSHLEERFRVTVMARINNLVEIIKLQQEQLVKHEKLIKELQSGRDNKETT